MPGIVLALEGRKRALNAYLRDTNTDIVFRFHLYTNNYTPTPAVTLADMDEMTAAGYAVVDRDSSDWAAPVDDGTCSQCAAPVIDWISTDVTDDEAYGYYVTDTADGALLWAESFGAALPFTPAGQTISLTPNYNNQTGTPC